MYLPSFLTSFFRNRSRSVTNNFANSESRTGGAGHLPISNPPTYRTNPLGQQSEPPTYRSLPSYRAQNNGDQLILVGQEGLSRDAAMISRTHEERLVHGGVREDDHDVPAFLREDTFTPDHSPQHQRNTSSRPSVFEIFGLPVPEASLDNISTPRRVLRRQPAALDLANMYSYLPE
jgi:hypothetical protein